MLQFIVTPGIYPATSGCGLSFKVSWCKRKFEIKVFSLVYLNDHNF